MKITVMSRKSAVEYCRQAHNTRSIMISVSDPYNKYSESPFCTDENGVLQIQDLYFCDADRPGKDVYGREVTEEDLFGDSHAFVIKRFLSLHPGTDIIVHCDAGISRSSGIAAAILKAYTGDDSQIFNSPRYVPNMRCYRVLLEELMKG